MTYLEQWAKRFDLRWHEAETDGVETRLIATELNDELHLLAEAILHDETFDEYTLTVDIHAEQIAELQEQVKELQDDFSLGSRKFADDIHALRESNKWLLSQAGLLHSSDDSFEQRLTELRWLVEELQDRDGGLGEAKDEATCHANPANETREGSLATESDTVQDKASFDTELGSAPVTPTQRMMQCGRCNQPIRGGHLCDGMIVVGPIDRDGHTPNGDASPVTPSEPFDLRAALTKATEIPRYGVIVDPNEWMVDAVMSVLRSTEFRQHAADINHNGHGYWCNACDSEDCAQDLLTELFGEVEL